MAKTISYGLPSLSGRLGNVIYSKSQGIDIAKIHNPKRSVIASESQLVQRKKMKLLGKTAKGILPALNFSFKQVQKKLSGLNYFYRKNTPFVSVSEGMAHYTDLTFITFSEGSIEPFTAESYLVWSDNHITYNPLSYKPKVEPEVPLHYVQFNLETGLARHKNTEIQRYSLEESNYCPDAELFDYNNNFYFFFVSADKKKVSEARNMISKYKFI